MNGSTSQLILLAAMAGVFWLLFIRPQQQQRKRQQEMVQALGPGVRIMTTSGLFGTVEAVVGDRVMVEVADGVVVEILRAAIARVLDERSLDEEDASEAEEAESDEPAAEPPLIGEDTSEQGAQSDRSEPGA